MLRPAFFFAKFEGGVSRRGARHVAQGGGWCTIGPGGVSSDPGFCPDALRALAVRILTRRGGGARARLRALWFPTLTTRPATLMAAGFWTPWIVKNGPAAGPGAGQRTAADFLLGWGCGDWEKC